MSDAAKKKKRQTKIVSRKKKNSTMPLNQSKKILIERKDEEFQITMKVAREKLEDPMTAALFCKTLKKVVEKPTQYWETKNKICLY